jgi:hypothetical protein
MNWTVIRMNARCNEYASELITRPSRHVTQKHETYFSITELDCISWFWESCPEYPIMPMYAWLFCAYCLYRLYRHKKRVLHRQISHRWINIDHGINVYQHLKPRNTGKYSIYCICPCFVVFSADLHWFLGEICLLPCTGIISSLYH